MIKIQPLQSKDIDFLNDKNTLYVCDFRAIGESMEYKIPAMRKYENLLGWIVEGQRVCVNEWSKQLPYTKQNKYEIVDYDNDPRTSVYKRFENIFSTDNTTTLWSAIPHPDADEFSKVSSLISCYSYDEFLEKNNKIALKELLGNLSPKWEVITNASFLEKIQNNGFLKRRHGSGGFTVFPVEKAKIDQKFLKLFKEEPNEWYFEEFFQGEAHSIQCLTHKDSTDVTIFGFSRQFIVDQRYFCGAKILSLDSLQPAIREKLIKGIERMEPLFKSYGGFFGVDFLVDSAGNMTILEANIRLTAMTVPTILYNEMSLKNKSVEYREDISYEDVMDDDIVLAIDEVEKTKDILRYT